MNLVRGASLGENPSLRGKLEQVLRQMIDPIVRDLQRLKFQGGIRTDLDYRVIVYMVMGMAEYAAMLAHKGAYPAETLHEAFYTLFLNGIEG